jgi:[ribosomal protein S5]-alanine N-acetyltransferase
MSNLKFPASIPTLVGKTVSLRELREEDIAPWFERATDAESADLAGDPIPKSIDAGQSWLQKHRDAFTNKSGLRWSMVPTGSSTSVGTIGLTVRPSEPPYAELGIVVARQWWSKGLGGEAAEMVVSYAFREVGLREIRAEVLQRNLASIRLLEKTGFQLTQILPPTQDEPEVMLAYSRSARST